MTAASPPVAGKLDYHPAAGLARRDAETATRLLHGTPGNRQSPPTTVAAGSAADRDPRAVVAYLEAHSLRLATALDSDAALAVLQRVGDQVAEHLCEPPAVSPDRHLSRPPVHLQAATGAMHDRLPRTGHVRNEAVERQRLGAARRPLTRPRGGQIGNAAAGAVELRVERVGKAEGGAVAPVRLHSQRQSCQRTSQLVLRARDELEAPAQFPDKQREGQGQRPATEGQSRQSSSVSL